MVSTQRIPWNAWPPAEEQLRDILTQHYPSVAIEFIERNEGSGISQVQNLVLSGRRPTAPPSFSASTSAGPSDRPAGFPLPRRRPNGHRRGRRPCAVPSKVVAVFRSWSCSSTVSSGSLAQRLLRQIRSSSRTRPRIRKTCPARMIRRADGPRGPARPVLIDQPIKRKAADGARRAQPQGRPGQHGQHAVAAGTAASQPTRPASVFPGRSPRPVSGARGARHGPHQRRSFGLPRRARRFSSLAAGPGPKTRRNAATVRRFPSRRRFGPLRGTAARRRLGSVFLGRRSRRRGPAADPAKWKLPSSPQTGARIRYPHQARGCRKRLVRSFDTTWCSMNRHAAMLNCNDSVDLRPAER